MPGRLVMVSFLMLLVNVSVTQAERHNLKFFAGENIFATR
jgi:hypothetical protein